MLCVSGFYVCYSQDQSFKYLGQTEPDESPKVFYLPVIEWTAADRIAISSDYKEIYFTEFSGSEKKYARRIKYFKNDGTTWKGPFLFCENCECPLFSPDNNMLMLNGDYYQRTDTGWTTPIRFLKENKVVHYLQYTNPGNYYFLSYVNDSTTDVFRVVINEQDTITEPMGFNMKSTVQNDYYIDPDEEYILFSLNEKEIECYGGKDIFIRFRINDGWTDPVNLGQHINVENSRSRYGMCMSPDKKYMFYTQIDEGKVRIFWVKVDELFLELKEKYRAEGYKLYHLN